jgi:hypothetical protein
MPPHYASLRKKSLSSYRQKLLWGLFPVPGTEPVNPPANHHSVDLATIQKKIELNRASIRYGRVIYPGLGVSKHPMTVVTSTATYLVGWASTGGVRSVSIVGESSMFDAKILFLYMGEPMVFIGLEDMVCVTKPVIFIGRRQYQGISALEAPIDSPTWSDELEYETDASSIELPRPVSSLHSTEKQ